MNKKCPYDSNATLMLLDHKCYCHGGQEDCQYRGEEEELRTRPYLREIKEAVRFAARCGLEEMVKNSPAEIRSIKLRPYVAPKKKVHDGVFRKPVPEE